MEQLSMAGGGSVSLREEGARVLFEAVRPDDGRGLYKLRIQGPGGRLDLGTLMPERGELRLRRGVSLTRLRETGCWPVTGAEAVLSVPFAGRSLPEGWVREEAPARHLKADPLLEEAARSMTQVLYRRAQGRFQLAQPFGEGLPLALTPIFCFARVQSLGDRSYAVFTFSDEGVPLMPE